MKTKSIDVLVRDALMDDRLTLHYYTRYLHHALRIMDELSLHFDLGNIKSTELELTSYKRVPLPADFIDVVNVDAKNGERSIPLERDRLLNKRYNFDDSGNKIPYPAETPLGVYEEYSASLLSMGKTINFRGEQTGRLYGRIRKPAMVYDIDTLNQELVFGNDMPLTKVTLIYITNAVSMSNANVVTPYATDVITKYIKWMARKAENGRLGSIASAENEYQNALRKFKSTMYSIDYAEILGSIRSGYHATIKN
jgi:hypothetical protein